VTGDGLALIDALAGPIAALDAQVRQRAKTEPGVKVLTQLPGVGEFTALVILAETGDVTRFSSARKLAAWAGLTPTVRGPAAPSATAGSPNKARPGCAGWALGQAAQTAKRSPEFTPTYQAISARRGKQIATTAIARKLLTRAWHLLTDAGITGPALSPPPRLSTREGAPRPGRARKVHEPAPPPRTSC
jgi:transposase